MNTESRGKLERMLDALSSALIYFAVIFSPWAFGSTEPWSMRILNWAGWTLGLISALQWALRFRRPAAPSRWGAEALGTGGRLLIWTVAAASLFLVAWCWISAWNASAAYSPQTLQFDYLEHIPWLPHSFDAGSSWSSFRNYSALACFFWALRAWLMTKTAQDVLPDDRPKRVLPIRLRRLLWILSINGAALALESLLQRLSGSTRLLWLVQPTVNPGAESQFGPYAYRSNAAQYFNLLWPLTLGFWFLLHAWQRRSAPARPLHHLLLSCVMLMAACPLVSDSRAGAVVTGGELVCSGFLLVAAFRGAPWSFRGALAGFTLLTLALGLNMGWESLTKRMTSLDVDYHGREEIYSTARKMAVDYPWFGTGPGTFDPLFQMYRKSPDQYWPAQLHNDWLETRITFGRIGMAVILAALAGCGLHWFVRGAIRTPWIFPAFVGLGLTGCLLHALVDYPFQVYSIVLLFLLECGVLLGISRKS